MLSATWVPGLPDKNLWKKVNMGFKLLPPILKRAAGRPRTRRYKGVEEGGSTKRRARCKRCQGFGHLQKTCTEPVPDPDAPPPAPPKPKRARKKPKKVHVTTAPEASKDAPAAPTAPEASKDAPAAPTKLRKKIKKVHVATEASKDAPAPTKSRKNTKKVLAASETSKAVPDASNAPEASIKTPQRKVPSLDHQEMGLTTSSGSPLTRARKALLLATNHQEMGLTTSPGSPLTREKKALLLGKQN